LQVEGLCGKPGQVLLSAARTGENRAPGPKGRANKKRKNMTNRKKGEKHEQSEQFEFHGTERHEPT